MISFDRFHKMEPTYLDVYIPEFESFLHGTGLDYPDTPNFRCKCLRVTKNAFVEANAFSASTEPKSSYAIETFSIPANVNIPVNAKVVFVNPGSEDDGQTFAVITPERRFTWFFKDATIHCKRTDI